MWDIHFYCKVTCCDSISILLQLIEFWRRFQVVNDSTEEESCEHNQGWSFCQDIIFELLHVSTLFASVLNEKLSLFSTTMIISFIFKVNISHNSGIKQIVYAMSFALTIFIKMIFNSILDSINTFVQLRIALSIIICIIFDIHAWIHVCSAYRSYSGIYKIRDISKRTIERKCSLIQWNSVTLDGRIS